MLQENTHNDFIFRLERDDVSLIRDFEGMYGHCEDPHGQSQEMDNLSYRLVSTAVDRAVEISRYETNRPLSIIDLGCGLGYFTGHLKKKFPDAYVCGIDISSRAIERASRIASDCVFQQADLKSPKLTIAGGKRFHIAVALDSLYYFKDDEIEGVLSNIRSLIVDAGFLMVGYHLPEDMRFGRYIESLGDARRLLKAHDIDVVYSFEVHNSLDASYDGSPVGHHLYFLARKKDKPGDNRRP